MSDASTAPDASVPGTSGPGTSGAPGGPAGRAREERTTGSGFVHARPLVLHVPGRSGLRLPDGRRRAAVLAGTVLSLSLLGICLTLPGGSDDRPVTGPPGSGDPLFSGSHAPGGSEPPVSRAGTGSTGGARGSQTVEAAREEATPSGNGSPGSSGDGDAAQRSTERPGPTGGNGSQAPSTSRKPTQASSTGRTTGAPGDRPVAFGDIAVRNIGSGLFLAASGTRIVQLARSTSAGQVWGFADAGDARIMLVLSSTGTCLGSSTLPAVGGTEAVVRSCSGDAVRWRLRGAPGSSILLEQVSSGLCLGIANRSGAVGGGAVLTSCSGTTSAEHWGLEQR